MKITLISLRSQSLHNVWKGKDEVLTGEKAVCSIFSEGEGTHVTTHGVMLLAEYMRG